MNCRSSNAVLRALAAASVLIASTASAIEYRAVDAPVAVMYDAPSAKGKRLFLLRRFTPVEQIVAVEGFVKVREPEGALGWVEKKALTERRQVMVSAARAQVRLNGDDGAALVFEADKGVALELVEGAKDGWAKVRHLDGPAGMVRVSQVWGL